MKFDHELKCILAKEFDGEVLVLLMEVSGVVKTFVRMYAAIRQLNPLKIDREELKHVRAVREDIDDEDAPKTEDVAHCVSGCYLAELDGGIPWVVWVLVCPIQVVGDTAGAWMCRNTACQRQRQQLQVQVGDLEREIARLNGRIRELEHPTGSTRASPFAAMQADLEQQRQQCGIHLHERRLAEAQRASCIKMNRKLEVELLETSEKLATAQDSTCAEPGGVERHRRALGLWEGIFLDFSPCDCVHAYLRMRS